MSPFKHLSLVPNQADHLNLTPPFTNWKITAQNDDIVSLQSPS